MSRKDQERLEQVTESVDEGRLTQDAARNHPFGHVLTRVIGIDPDVDAQVTLGRFDTGDVILLCTDGLIRVVDESRIIDHDRPLRRGRIYRVGPLLVYRDE